MAIKTKPSVPTIGSLLGPKEVKLDFQLHQAQQVVARSPARFVYLMAGRSFGKTKLMAYRLLKAAEKPGARIWYVAPFKNQAEEIAWLDLLNIIPPSIIERAVATKLTIHLTNGSIITFKGADKDSVRGPKLDFLGVDEAQDLRPDVFQKVLFPTLAGKQGRCLLIGTKKPNNWFRKRWIDVHNGEVPEAQSIYYPSTANTLIPPEEWEILRKNTDPLIWEQEYVSNPLTRDFDGAGIKYEEFDRSKHVVPAFHFDGSYKFYRGMDWGMNHPTVCLWAAVSPTGTIYIYDELAIRGKSVEEVSVQIKNKNGDRKIEATVLDPQCWRKESDNLSIAHRFHEAGIPVFPGKKEDGANSGVNALKSYLRPASGKPKVLFFPFVNGVMDELEKLLWENKSGDDYSDALRYLTVFLSAMDWSEHREEPALTSWTLPTDQPPPFKITRPGEKQYVYDFDDTGYIS